MHDLAAIDLNLVVALHALLEERNVTRAARRIGISQPAMSHALARLRDHFGDPLLVRSGRAMVPTARATSMRAHVRETIGELSRLMAPGQVEPASLPMDLRLVTDDWMGTTLLPRIVARLAGTAPGVDLDVSPRGTPGRKALLLSGAVDLALGFFSGAGLDLHRQHLFDDDWVTVLRRGHPALASELTPERWASLIHVLVAPTGGKRGAVDLGLQALGLVRRVGVVVPHFHTAVAVVAGSDHVLTVPRTVVSGPGTAGIVILAPPVSLAPIPVSMLWHARTHPDPVQRWLRDLVERVASET